MTIGRDGDDEVLARFAALAAEPCGPCADPNLLALVMTGSPTDAERAEVFNHLSGCPECRGVAASLLESEATKMGSRQRMRLRSGVFLPLLLAASVLIALVVFWRGENSQVSLEAELQAKVATLAARDAQLFAGFQIATPDELTGPPPDLRRGASAIRAPLGKLLDSRPSFSWQPAFGLATWQLEVSRADGSRMWKASVTGAQYSYPATETPLGPGKYLVEVRGEGPLGPEQDAWVFEVASPDLKERNAAGLRSIAAALPPELAVPMSVHWALHLGLWYEAEAILSSAGPLRADREPEHLRLLRGRVAILLGRPLQRSR